MDVQALELPAGSFDLVASAFVIHLLERPAAGVAEAYRVLAPGRRFAFTGSSARQPNNHRNDPWRLDALFGEFTRFLPPGGSMGQPIDAADLLADAGFVDLRADPVEIAVPFTGNAMLWRWLMSHGYRAFVEDLPADRRSEFHARVLALPGDDRLLRRRTSIRSGRKPV
jgi:SAM-dependent methyltransferase